MGKRGGSARLELELLHPPPGFLIPLFPLLLPLPFQQDRYEVPQVKLRPEALQKDNGSILMALPQHEITKPDHTAGADEQV